MEFVGRIILRLIVVPLGATLAVIAGTIAAFIAHWNRFVTALDIDPSAGDPAVLAWLFAAFAWSVAFAVATVKMLMPGAIGVLAAEVFTIRSWMFHVLNGAVSVWVGWWTQARFSQEPEFNDNPLIILAVGLVAGFVYWAIAGWNAGLFRPVQAGPQPPAPATTR